MAWAGAQCFDKVNVTYVLLHISPVTLECSAMRVPRRRCPQRWRQLLLPFRGTLWSCRWRPRSRWGKRRWRRWGRTASPGTCRRSQSTWRRSARRWWRRWPPSREPSPGWRPCCSGGGGRWPWPRWQCHHQLKTVSYVKYIHTTTSFFSNNSNNLILWFSNLLFDLFCSEHTLQESVFSFTKCLV